MKLYTEEQVREAHQNGRHGGNNETWYNTDEYINSLTPIELPSDEEIEDNAKDYANLIGNKNGTSIFDYVRGAKWMRYKILNN